MIQNLAVLFFRMSGIAGCSAAEGEVCRIRAKHHGILNGYHVVRIVSAAFFAEHLHGQDLRIRRHALRHHRIQRGCISAVRVLHEAVCRRNAGNVRAVVALLVVVMGDVGVGIHIVEAEGNLRVDIKIRRGKRGDALDSVQLRQHLA